MMKRRNFLQLTGSTLAALGMSHLDIMNQGNRYAKVLSENTPRKLALLVGITEYPKIKRFEKQQLEGCVNDVRLQKELLVHRFGFCPDDIVTLTTKKDTPYEFKPTRKNILEKFEEHLIKQAKPGDIVVFHFSGHGSHLRDPRPIKNCDDKKILEFNSTLAVIDESQKNFAPDIMGRTLFLLRLALQKKGVTKIKNRTLQLKLDEPLVVGKPGQIELKAVEKGLAEALIVTSRSELKNAAKMLQQLVRENGRGGRGQANTPIDISRGEAVAVIDDLLDDLSGSCGGSSQPREVKAENIATLSMSFEVG